MNPVTIGLIIGGLALVWIYGKMAAAKAAQAQSPQLSVPQGSIASSILSSLGIATQSIPSLAAQTAAYGGPSGVQQALVNAPYEGTTAAGVPSALEQASAGMTAGWTPTQIIAANQLAQTMESAQGSTPDVTVSLSSSLVPQDGDGSDGDLCSQVIGGSNLGS